MEKRIEFINTKEDMQKWIIATGNTLYDVVLNNFDDYTDINVELVDGRIETYCRIPVFKEHTKNLKVYEIAHELTEYLENN